MAINVLDNPVWHALIGPQSAQAEGQGLARHYPRDMAPFSAIAEASDVAYADLLPGLPPGTEARLFRLDEESLPVGWRQLDCFPMLQMVAKRAPSVAADKIVALGNSDLDAMMELVAVAKPGPFGRRTPQLGRYIGVKDGDRLLALAGERMRLPGYKS